MEESPIRRHGSTPAELRDRLQAERAGVAFLVLRDGDGRQRIEPLDPGARRVTIGRGAGTEIRLAWDTRVSRLHAEIEYGGGAWTVVDGGISANGTWLNGELLRGRRRLEDGDTIRLGHTVMVFRAPAVSAETATVLPTDGGRPPEVSEAQRRVLVALARPYRDGGAFATPPTNRAIADEVFLSLDAVKAHLRGLFERFGIADLPQNRKRARLVELAFLYGVVSEGDFGEP